MLRAAVPVPTSSAVDNCRSTTTHGLATLLYYLEQLNWPAAKCISTVSWFIAEENT
jgi:hypothetical protein